MESLASAPAAPLHDAIESGSQAIAQQNQESSSAAGTPAIPPQTGERRLHARRRVKSLSYIELGQTNGGIIINMSEEGLQVQAAVALTGDRISLMRFQLPQSSDRIEVGGNVAWRSESQKEAGIQFVDLPEEARVKLREWVASEPPSIGIHAVKAPAREKSAPLPELPKVQEPGRALREPGTSDRPVLRPQPLVAASSPLALSPLPQRSSRPEPAPAAPAPALLIMKSIGETQSEPRRKSAFAWMNLGLQRRTWEIIAGVIAVVSTISFTSGWIAARRSAQSAMAPVSEMKQEVPSSEPTTSVPPPSASAIAHPPSGAGEKAPAPAPQPATTPAAATKNSSSASSTTNTARAENKAPQKPAPSPIPSTSKASKATGNDAATGAIQSPAPVAASAAIVANSSVKSNASPGAPVAPAQPAQTPRVAPIPAPERPAIANATTPAAAANENAAPAPVKKEPEIPAAAPGTVSVGLPPFPSIRVSAELKAQSSKIGTSLQIGQPISRVTPAYPEDIRRQRIEGTVKLHAIVGKDGAVQKVTLVSGPAILAAPAINAILEWRYKPTLFGGQAIETEEDITVIFRLQNPPASSN